MVSMFCALNLLTNINHLLVFVLPDAGYPTYGTEAATN